VTDQVTEGAIKEAREEMRKSGAAVPSPAPSATPVDARGGASGRPAAGAGAVYPRYVFPEEPVSSAPAAGGVTWSATGDLIRPMGGEAGGKTPDRGGAAPLGVNTVQDKQT